MVGFASNADSTLGTDKKVQFRDAAIYLNSSADGQLDIVADGEVQIDTALVDINGNLDVSGTTNISGSVSFTNNAIAGVAISTTSRASNTVTVTTSAVHGLTSGDLVNVNGVADTSFNGYFTASVSSTTVFTYSQTGADGSSTGGTSTEVVYNLNASGTALNWMNGPLNIAANSGIDGLEITQSGSGNGLHVTGTTGLVGNTTLTGNLDVSGTTVSAGKITADAGIDIDNINIDGTTIALSSGDLTLDVAGDIILDADGGDVILKNGGTHWGSIYTNATPAHLYIQSMVQDQDIILAGFDGASSITALILDMSNAGAATFNGTIAGTRISLSDGVDDAGSAGSESVFNNGGTTADFRVESSGNANMLFVDGGANHVNIGTATDLQGVLNVDGNISLSGNGSGNRSVALLSESNLYEGSLIIQAGGVSAAYGGGIRLYGHSHASKPGDVVAGISGGSGGSFRVNSDGVDTGTDRLEVTEDGSFTTTPAAGNHAVFNEDGIDADFRVESRDNANMVFVNGENNSVAIGGSNDNSAQLFVEGNIRRGGYTTLSNFNSNNDVIAFNYKIAPSATTVTPIYSGSVSAGGSFIQMESGGGGTLDFRSALHGTDASAFAYTEAGKYLTMRPTS